MLLLFQLSPRNTQIGQVIFYQAVLLGEFITIYTYLYYTRTRVYIIGGIHLFAEILLPIYTWIVFKRRVQGTTLEFLLPI